VTRILGIETSCDETAAAVVRDRCHVESSVIASQVAEHGKFGGVVPEIASRMHIEAIGPVIERALEEAGRTLDDMDAIAVTRGPGLIGCLLVGLSAAKAIAWQRDLPLLAVHHLEGHIRSCFIETPDIQFPVLALVVSGGHTSIYRCPEESVYELLARTRDDAAGEAFDKVGKLVGLSYPGGPAIDRISRGANERAYDFPQPKMKDGSLDFSFSGLKTAVRQTVIKAGFAQKGLLGDESSTQIADLVASFQYAAVSVLLDRTLKLCKRESINTVLVTGGVACNGRLRTAFAELAKAQGLTVHIPSPILTTDNAAMIAAAGFLHLERGQIATPDINADASLKLGA
jgi:N6-L-threonylcarbamoyladenine synthase